MKTKTLTKRINRILTLVLTIVALMVGQNVWATTKTVTYTLSRYQQGTYDYLRLTHSGDTPFDGTTAVEDQMMSNRTSASFTLPDGFTFNFTWGGGATITWVSSGYFFCANANVWSLRSKLQENIKIF